MEKKWLLVSEGPDKKPDFRRVDSLSEVDEETAVMLVNLEKLGNLIAEWLNIFFPPIDPNRHLLHDKGGEE